MGRERVLVGLRVGHGLMRVGGRQRRQLVRVSGGRINVRGLLVSKRSIVRLIADAIAGVVGKRLR